MKKLNPNALGLAAASLSALGMLVLGVLAMLGLYMEAFAAMQAWHLWFDATVVGVLLGILEAGVISYVGGYLFGLFYNKFA